MFVNFARVAVPSRYVERSAFDRLVDRYHRQAYNVAYRMTGNHADAEDLTQESFLRAYRFFDRYDPTLPFENWLYRIMSRVLVDEIRKRPKAPHQSLYQRTSNGDTVCLEIEDTQPNPEQQLLSEALDEYLQEALNTLPHDFRVAVILADVEGLSYEEIAEATGSSAGTVRSRLHRGRKLLRQRIHAAAPDRGLAEGVTAS
ncbi:MAG: sigma-70 family RNA polymerase sigma factor [Armatimonadetes bacterium]|nr:sigma-70 family RNA polymerase sigma factor [Armatimonadota bacterium]MDE2207031.1 sigma-70 family RNA polymerase sigma factor [Armatimonadota bacterium]